MHLDLITAAYSRVNAAVLLYLFNYFYIYIYIFLLFYFHTLFKNCLTTPNFLNQI